MFAKVDWFDSQNVIMEIHLSVPFSLFRLEDWPHDVIERIDRWYSKKMWKKKRLSRYQLLFLVWLITYYNVFNKLLKKINFQEKMYAIGDLIRDFEICAEDVWSTLQYMSFRRLPYQQDQHFKSFFIWIKLLFSRWIYKWGY